MTESFFLSAFTPEQRKMLLMFLETDSLRELCHNPTISHNEALARCISDERIAQEVEITISYEHF